MPGLIGLLIPLEGATPTHGWPPGPESFNSRPLFPELGSGLVLAEQPSGAGRHRRRSW